MYKGKAPASNTSSTTFSYHLAYTTVMNDIDSSWLIQVDSTESEFPYRKRHPQRCLWVSCPTPLEVDWPHTWIQSHPQPGPTTTTTTTTRLVQEWWRTRPRGCSSRCWLCSHLELKPRQAAQKPRITCNMIVFPERLLDLGASSNSGTNREISCMRKMMWY